MKYNYAFKYITADGTHWVGSCVATSMVQVLELLGHDLNITFIEQRGLTGESCPIAVTGLCHYKEDDDESQS